MPLLSMSNSVLLCISTLLESGNHYSKMFELQVPFLANLACDLPTHESHLRTPRANHFLSRLKSRLSVTTASRAMNLRHALIGYTRCLDGYRVRRWRWFVRSLPMTRPCCYASRWALAPIRRKRPFRVRPLTRFLNGRASRSRSTSWANTLAATRATCSSRSTRRAAATAPFPSPQWCSFLRGCLWCAPLPTLPARPSANCPAALQTTSRQGWPLPPRTREAACINSEQIEG